MPLTTPDLSTDAPALSGLLGDGAALGVSPLCCEWIGVTPVLWVIGAEAPSTARDGRGRFGHSASRAGSLWRSPALARRKLADRNPVRAVAAPLPFFLPDGCPIVSFPSGTAVIATAGMGGDVLSAPGGGPGA